MHYEILRGRDQIGGGCIKVEADDGTAYRIWATRYDSDMMAGRLLE